MSFPKEQKESAAFSSIENLESLESARHKSQRRLKDNKGKASENIEKLIIYP